MNDGGPAFPSLETAFARDGQDGMSLRDYFAAKAMTAALHHYPNASRDHIAAVAYQLADAMLKERTK